MRAAFFLASAACALAAGDPKDPAPPPRLVLKAAHVVVSPGKTIPRGVVVIEDGKIAAVGTDLGAPQGARVLDFGDATISAGLVDARVEAGAEGEIVDNTTAFEPAVRAIDAFLPNKKSLARAASEGITTLGLAPQGRNVASGIAAIVKPARPGRVVKEEAYSLFSFDGTALHDDRFPTSLSAALAEWEKRMRAAQTDPGAKTTDGKVLARAAKDLRPWIEVGDPSTLHQVSRICAALKLHPIVLATGDLADGARVLVEAKIPVALRAPTFDSPPVERRQPGLLAKAGVEIAFVSGGTSGDSAPLALRAGMAVAVASGLDRNAGFAAITTNPARWLGLEAQAGTIEAGRDADVVVWSGDPTNLTSGPRAVFVDGVLVAGGSKP